MIQIRKMKEEDKETLYEMMRTFYDSDALLTTPDDSVIWNNINGAIDENNEYLEGYILEYDGNTAGYGLCAHAWCTEFGGKAVWLEDLYILEEYRSKGLGTYYFNYMYEKYHNTEVKVLRLEVEEENTLAIRNYRRNNFEELPYIEMVRTTD